MRGVSRATGDALVGVEVDASGALTTADVLGAAVVLGTTTGVGGTTTGGTLTVRTGARVGALEVCVLGVGAGSVASNAGTVPLCAATAAATTCV
jgi:hypothetical protein